MIDIIKEYLENNEDKKILIYSNNKLIHDFIKSLDGYKASSREVKGKNYIRFSFGEDYDCLRGCSFDMAYVDEEYGVEDSDYLKNSICYPTLVSTNGKLITNK